METENPETEVILWPKVTKNGQRFFHAGVRTDRDPALLPCHGACGKPKIRWTWHYMVNSSTFQCESCKTSRRWGLGFVMGPGHV